jgi:hypothetical protein
VKVNLGFLEPVLALQVFAWNRRIASEDRAAFFDQSIERLSSLPA